MARFFAGVLVAIFLGGSCVAETYPSRRIEIVAGYAAGGGMDILARYYARQLSVLSGQAVTVMNKPGATGNLASQDIAQSKPDGYRLLWGATANFVSNQFLFKQLPYDADRDFTIVATTAEYGFMLVAREDSSIRDVRSLLDVVRAKEKALYGASGTTGRIAGEMFKKIANVKAGFVAYKTSQDVLRDVIAGDIDFAVVDATAALARERQGGLKVLAITMDRRISASPDVPSMIEAGLPGYALSGWMAVAAPKGTPSDIVAKLNEWIAEISAMPETREYLRNAAAEPLALPLAQIPSFIGAQTEKWRMMVGESGVEPQ